MAKKGTKEYTMWVELRGATEKFTQDMNSAVGRVTRVEKQLTGVAKNIQRVFQAALVIGGVVAIKKLTDQLGVLAEKGEIARSIEEGFRKLGGSSGEIDKAKKSVLGMVDSFDLMKIANTGLVKQIPGFNENFSKMAELGARLANTLGTDTKDAIQQVVDAIGSGKVAQLQAVGITINAYEAYKKYADSIGVASDQLTKQEQKVAIAIEAERKLGEAIGRQAEVTDSVANAQGAFNRAIEEGSKRAGIAINSNQQLTTAWRELEAAVDAVDWGRVGKEIAQISSIFLNMATAVLPQVTRWLDEIARGFNVIFGNDAQAKANNMALKIEALEEAATGARVRAEYAPGPQTQAEYDRAQAELDGAIEKFKTLKQTMDETRAAEEKAANSLSGAAAESNKAGLAAISGAAKRADAEEKVNVKVANNMLEEQTKAHEKSVAFWQSAFENAITGVSFNLEDALKQVAVGFAAEIAASFTGLSFEGGIKELGSKLAQSIFGTGAGLLGRPEGVSGPLMENGSFAGMGAAMSSFIPAAAAAVGTYLAGRSLQDLIHGKTDNSPQGKAGRAQLAISSSGLSEVARLFSAFGGHNAGHDARKNVAGFIENATGKDFKVGASSKFDTDKGFAALRKLDKETQDFFKGFGQVLTTVVGVGSDASEQIASLLVENTEGSVNKAKAIWKSLGISFEDAQQKIIALGIESGKTWNQIEGEIAAAERLSKPGRDGKGDYVGAFQEIIDSGAKGMEATNAVVSNGIEAAEKQFKNLDEWKTALKTQFAPEQVDIFFQALSQRGVTNFDQLENASVRTSGAIIADMQTLGFAFEDVTAKIKEADVAMRDLTSSSPDKVEGVDIPKFGKGGIVTRPTLAIVGESGPEIIMPMNKLSGANPAMRAAGGGGMVVNIDARGAAPGVDQAILRAMREVSEASVARGINNFVRTQSRGGRGV